MDTDTKILKWDWERATLSGECVLTEGSNNESAAAANTNRRRKYVLTCPGSEWRHTRTRWMLYITVREFIKN